jgi:hypothetical protein
MRTRVSVDEVVLDPVNPTGKRSAGWARRIADELTAEIVRREQTRRRDQEERQPVFDKD